MDQDMQEQAFLTQQLWLNASNAVQGIIENIWRDNYTITFEKMQKAVSILKNSPGSESTMYEIGTIALSICKSRIEMASVLGRDCMDVKQEFVVADRNFKSGEFTMGFIILHHAFDSSNKVINRITEAN
jgi:hypothetical protein